MNLLIASVIVIGYYLLCALLIWVMWSLIDLLKIPKRSKPVLNTFGILIAMSVILLLDKYYFLIWDAVGLLDISKDGGTINFSENEKIRTDIIVGIKSVFAIWPIFLLAYFVNTLVNAFFWYGMFIDDEGESMVPKLLRQIAMVLLYIVATGAVITIFKPDFLNHFLAGLGATGAVGAFLSKEPVKQAFTALSLNINKQIKKGDVIEMNDYLGEVQEIGWKAIKLLTPDNNLLTIPNVMLINSCYINHSRPNAGSTVRLEIELDASIPPAKVEGLLKRCAEDSNLIISDAKVKVLNFQGDNALYLIEVQTDSTDLNSVKSQILSSIWYMLRRQNLVDRPAGYSIDNTFERTIVLLNSISILESLTEQEDSIIAEKAEWLKYGPLERIMIEGEYDYSLCIIAEGEVEILKKQEDGKFKVITKLPKNSILGEQSFLTGQPRGATVRSIKETLVCKISRESLKPILSNRPEIMEVLSEALAEKEAQNELASNKYKDDMSKRASKQSAKQRFLSSIKNFFSDDEQVVNNTNEIV